MPPVVAHTLVRKNERVPPSESSALFAVDSACQTDGWHSVACWQTLGEGRIEQEPLNSTASWTFAPKPPVIKRTGMPQTLPEWGKLSNLEEVFETRELPEFQSSYIKSTVISEARRRTLAHRDVGEVSGLGIEVSSLKRRRDIFASDLEEFNSRERVNRTPKSPTPPILLVPSTFPGSGVERSSNTPFVSAHLFIDLPHCNPCPAPIVPPPPVSAEILAAIPEYPLFRKIESHPTSSYNLPELEWNAPFARGAWIVPLNGPALVSEGSPASVIDEYESVSLSGVSASSEATAEPKSPIHWTPNAVKAAWNTLRIVRKNNAMGSIGLYFERDDDDRKDLAHSRCSNTPSIAGNSSGSLARNPPSNARVRKNEWIKVCCDGVYALRIRMVLAQLKAKGDISANTRRTIREAGLAGDAQAQHKVLEGAKLVYVDELGSPILIA